MAPIILIEPEQVRILRTFLDPVISQLNGQISKNVESVRDGELTIEVLEWCRANGYPHFKKLVDIIEYRDKLVAITLKLRQEVSGVEAQDAVKPPCLGRFL